MTDVDLNDLSEIDAVAEIAKSTEPEHQDTQTEQELPAKFRGKSPAELVKMYQEAETVIGRQAQEVGDVRRLADELLKSSSNNRVEKVAEPEVDFFENPKEAIRLAVENNPKVIAAERFSQQSNRENVLRAITNAHPDFNDIVKDEEFVNWVKSNPKRIRSFQEAENYDFDSANDLLSTFKEVRQARTRVESNIETTARNNSIKAASVDVGGSGENSKKIYSRVALIQKKINDPSGYAAAQHEIDRAYAEGRVR